MVARLKKMGKEFFYIAFVKLKNGEYGQVAPFLLIVLVILLIASFALVNIGKVSLHRLQTANAADSAAIATASALAAIANNIGDSNQQLKIQFYALQAALLMGFNCWHPLCNSGVGCPQQIKDYALYRYYTGLLLTNYLFLMYSTEKGFKATVAQGHKTAFGNAGIQEAQIRDSATKEIQPSRLTRWLNKQAVNDPPLSCVKFTEPSYTFRWFGYAIDPATGKEARESEPSEVTSTVTINDCAFALDPMPLMPVVKTYKFFVTGIHDQPNPDCRTPKVCKCQADMDCLKQDETAFSLALKQITAQGAEARFYFAGVILGFNFLHGCIQPDVESIIAALIALIGAPVIVGIPLAAPKKQCIDLCPSCGIPTPAPKPALIFVTYIVPVPWIEGIANDDDIRVDTVVTYREPQRAAGLWQRKRTSTTSRARARLIPGNIDSPGSYDAELIGAQ